MTEQRAAERTEWLPERGEIARGGNKEPSADRETALDETARAEMREIIARYPEPRSALLPMLHLVQAYEGYVTPAGIEMCAEELGLTEAEVAAVATFYTMYKRRPMGEYHVGVCTNTLCAIMGGDQIWSELTEELGIGHDETTEDGKISLEHVECNAACDFAPVMVVNWEFMDNQTPQSARELVGKLRSGEEVRSTRGPSICTWQQAARILAGFPDGRAAEGPAAGAASLAGLTLAHQNGWTAPEGGRPALGTSGSDSQEDDR
ncbi:MAG TPA: NADH-quinone oxidoreductase subunit NuoE [Jiangellaceae bacterium]|nr:NADH-quinone oxidoreductase subunit NuoE [Jiangellaceae bacterium]